MAQQQQPIHVVVEKRGGCFSGCATTLAALLLIGIAIEYWYVSVGLLVLAVTVGVIANSQRKQKAQAAARRRPGPRDPWLNEVAVAVSELGLTEVARNTGNQLGGAPMEGDIALQTDRFLVYIDLFANGELARQAEIGLRAQQNIRNAVSSGLTALRTVGPILYVANGRRGVVDEFRLDEVAHTVGTIALPPALSVTAVSPIRAVAPAPGPAPADTSTPAVAPQPDTVEQIRKLAELRDAGVLTEAEFDAKKAELLRRI